MDLILWRDSFNTGTIRIDMQHKNLVRLINELFNTLGLSDKDSKIDQITLELYNYTINHFSLEESIMREFGFSEYQNHKKEHFNFVSKLNDFKAKLLTGDVKVDLEILNFLKDWLLNHILVVDKSTFSEIQKMSFK